MIRRFETYTFLDGTSEALRRQLAGILDAAGEHIEEIRNNAVGWNRSPDPVELVWEHAYESVDAYRRYMVHPYHAEMIDRHILVDSPERVVEPVTGAGLFGYHCGDASFVLESGARRVSLLKTAEPVTGSAPDGLVDRLARLTADAGGTLSVVGTNTLANAWFDGVTSLSSRPPKWSLVWEQGFGDLDALERFVAGTPELPAPIVGWTDLRYEVAVA